MSDLRQRKKFSLFSHIEGCREEKRRGNRRNRSGKETDVLLSEGMRQKEKTERR
jgi:hypothetical protein